MSGPLAKAALASYLPTWPPAPVISVFQYNPERMVHTWSQPEAPGRPGAESNNPLAVRGLPGESFQFTIFLNADDDMVSPVPPLKLAAEQSGVGARLAALEMLLYPGGPAGRDRVAVKRAARYRLRRAARLVRHLEPAELDAAHRLVLLEPEPGRAGARHLAVHHGDPV